MDASRFVKWDKLQFPKGAQENFADSENIVQMLSVFPSILRIP